MIKNYQLVKIYKIVCNTTGLIYIGSTVEARLCRRLVEHRHQYNQYLRGQHNYISSFEILDNDNYEILLIENYPCQSCDELRMRERYHIKNLECVNIYKRPFVTMEDKRENSRKYYNNNKGKESLRKQKFYVENKEKMDLRNNLYWKTHKTELNEKKMDYARRKKL